MAEAKHQELEALAEAWQARWEKALSAWSRFIKLAEPRWCLTPEMEQKQQLTGSFAMIRLADHAVVISLRQIKKLGLERFAVEIMAHEIGHHVYAPADLRDNGRLLARMRAALPLREAYTGMAANLYTDLLINDRLQRSAELDMAAVYAALPDTPGDRLWRLYLRIYEMLWNLPPQRLAKGPPDQKIDFDAGLGARLIRVYAKDWLVGAGRFAALILPYLMERPEAKSVTAKLPPWFDTEQAGASDEIPDGLAEIEAEELDGAVHPCRDEALSGVPQDEDTQTKQESSGLGAGKAERGGLKSEKRAVRDYLNLLKSIGVKVSEKEMVMRYYRELAAPLMIRFPERELPRAADPLPEGLDLWEPGAPLAEIDWTETMTRSPAAIPGVTTLKRVFGDSPGGDPKREPPDIYIGIDCSGSMTNPAFALSYPALAGVVIALSALRAGARAMVCLSGEPGSFAQTEGFVRGEREVLAMLTNYLGTGSSFGPARLKETFLDQPKLKRPAHVLVISDSDLFWALNQGDGWKIIEAVLPAAGGGGTFVLELDGARHRPAIERMQALGWDVFLVRSREELAAFAEAFSRKKYASGRLAGRRLTR